MLCRVNQVDLNKDIDPHVDQVDSRFEWLATADGNQLKLNHLDYLKNENS